MVLQDQNILEWTRDAIYIHLCVTRWFLFYIIAVKGGGNHEPAETWGTLLYSVSVMFCNCKWMLRSRKLNCKKYKQEVKNGYSWYSAYNSPSNGAWFVDLHRWKLPLCVNRSIIKVWINHPGRWMILFGWRGASRTLWLVIFIIVATLIQKSILECWRWQTEIVYLI